MKKLEACPSCGALEQREYLQCKDHFLSGEIFTLEQCQQCQLIYTNPRPELSKLGAYYKSENYISHSNSRTGLVNRVYHMIRKRNHKSKYQLLTKYIQSGSILDIGCASGEFLAYFKERNWDVTGVEPDRETREAAVKMHGLEVHDEGALEIMPGNTFSIISLWHVLEHVGELHPRMQNLKRILKDDGLLVIAVPNAASYDAQKYGSYWAGYDVPRHLYHFTQESISKLFDLYEMDCVGIEPMKYDAYYVSLLSEKYLKSSLKFYKALKTGLRSNRYAKKHENDYSSLIFLLKKRKTQF